MIIPDARVVPIEDSRTFVSEDQPEALAELVGGFAGGAGGGQARGASRCTSA